MSETQEKLKGVLRNLADGMDTGNTQLSDDQMEFLLDMVNIATSPHISTYTAQQMVKKATKKNKASFYNMIKDGRLPKGMHVQGFKEIHFNRYKIIQALKKLTSKDK